MCVCVCLFFCKWLCKKAALEPARLYQVKGIRGKKKKMEHLHRALVSKKIRQTERETQREREGGRERGRRHAVEWQLQKARTRCSSPPF